MPELKQERVLSWLRQGAQPTVTVRTLLRRAGVWKQFEAEKAAKKKKALRRDDGSGRTRDDRQDRAALRRAGRVKVRSFSDVPGRFDRLKQVRVLGPTGQPSNHRDACAARRLDYIMGLEGVTTPEEAGELRGGLIQVPRRPRRRCRRTSIMNVI